MFLAAGPRCLTPEHCFTATITNSTFVRNTADGGAGGAVFWQNRGLLVVPYDACPPPCSPSAPPPPASNGTEASGSGSEVAGDGGSGGWTALLNQVYRSFGLQYPGCGTVPEQPRGDAVDPQPCAAWSTAGNRAQGLAYGPVVASPGVALRSNVTEVVGYASNTPLPLNVTVFDAYSQRCTSVDGPRAAIVRAVSPYVSRGLPGWGGGKRRVTCMGSLCTHSTKGLSECRARICRWEWGGFMFRFPDPPGSHATPLHLTCPYLSPKPPHQNSKQLSLLLTLFLHLFCPVRMSCPELPPPPPPPCQVTGTAEVSTVQGDAIFADLRLRRPAGPTTLALYGYLTDPVTVLPTINVSLFLAPQLKQEENSGCQCAAKRLRGQPWHLVTTLPCPRLIHIDAPPLSPAARVTQQAMNTITHPVRPSAIALIIILRNATATAAVPTPPSAPTPHPTHTPPPTPHPTPGERGGAAVLHRGVPGPRDARRVLPLRGGRLQLRS